MIDWLTLNIDMQHIDERYRDVLTSQSERLIHISKEGEIKYSTSKFARVTVDGEFASDLCGLSINATTTSFTICGSPARTKQTHNVFGSSSIEACFHDMLFFVETALDVKLPHFKAKWNCTRIDFNQQYDLGSQTAVLQALSYLRHAETRGHNVTTSGTTVYWNKSSSHLSLKAYNKYVDLKRTIAKKQTHLDDELLSLTQGIIRFEMKVGRHYFAKLKERYNKHWYQLNQSDIKQLFEMQMNPILGDDMNVTDHESIRAKVIESAITMGYTEQMGARAYSTFNMIKLEGIESVKRQMKRSSFFLHQKILRGAGLSKADITMGDVLQFRRKTITIDQPIVSFNQLKHIQLTA